MIVGSPKEIFKSEARVAMTPESAKQIQKLGYTCILETGAGLQSNFSDKDYRDAGVKIVKTATECSCDIKTLFNANTIIKDTKI